MKANGLIRLWREKGGEMHLMLLAFAAIPGANLYVFMIILRGLNFVHIFDVGVGHTHTRSQRTFLVYRYLLHERGWIMVNQNLSYTS